MRRTLGLATIAAIHCLSGCAPHDPRATSVLALSGDVSRGRGLYAQTCAGCHRGDSEWRLTLQIYGQDGFVSTMIDGVPHTRMPSFSTWTDRQLADVHAYVQAAK